MRSFSAAGDAVVPVLKIKSVGTPLALVVPFTSALIDAAFAIVLLSLLYALN